MFVTQGGFFRLCLCLGVVGALLLSACKSNQRGPPPVGKEAPPTPDKLRVNDLVRVVFSGVPTPPPDHEERIKEDGTLDLQMVGEVQAAGKTAGELQDAIRDLYVPKYFRMLTVNVLAENRFFYVNGEVKQPNRYVYSGEVTVLRAVAAGGGFTDFAAKRRVIVTRNTGETFEVDCEQAKDDPAKDAPIYPGDQVLVPRKVLFGT